MYNESNSNYISLILLVLIFIDWKFSNTMSYTRTSLFKKGSRNLRHYSNNGLSYIEENFLKYVDNNQIFHLL